MHSAHSDILPPPPTQGDLKKYKNLKLEYDQHNKTFFEFFIRVLDRETGLKPYRTKSLKRIAEKGENKKRFVETIKSWHLKNDRLRKELVDFSMHVDAAWSAEFEGNIYSIDPIETCMRFDEKHLAI